ncbi:MAG: Eco57I restriction-modification methylase domain-containing protein, partial [Chloroflexota bacterium]|nr:Eco57I restriction-modification methylase domain-containing protein [Chloroflexota bacterium]
MSAWLEDRAELYRLDASRLAAEEDRTDLGQFLTPPPTARLLAGMFGPAGESVRLLDAGAGTGTLAAAFVAAMLDRAKRPSSITVTAYELDGRLDHYLHLTLKSCEEACRAAGVSFSYRVVQADFVAVATEMLIGGLFAPPLETFTHSIMNPPYRKIRTSSDTRSRLRAIGLEASNLYAGFVSAAVGLLGPGGELVAITPRSFCNGPYFAPFRHFLLARGRFSRIHVFRSRARAFRDQGVLQENVVFRFDRGATGNTPVVIASSFDAEDPDVLEREIGHDALVQPSDDGAVVHLAEEPLADRVTARIAEFSASLAGLGLAVSTGRVVDFRVREFLRPMPSDGDAPLIYPSHFAGGHIAWPRAEGRKPNAIRSETATSALLVPPGRYVLTRRFSAKEERRRVVAAIYDSDAVDP